jgi:hypothetical protein
MVLFRLNSADVLWGSTVRANRRSHVSDIIVQKEEFMKSGLKLRKGNLAAVESDYRGWLYGTRLERDGNNGPIIRTELVTDSQ